MSEFKIAVAQMDCVPGDVAANLERAEAFVASAARQGARIVVAPECATTGYFVKGDIRDLAEPIPGPTTQRLEEIARRQGTYVVIGVVERDGNTCYNASVLISPRQGLLGRYRKVHLFSAEKKVFAPGEEPAIFDTEFGRIALTICYDLVFPEYIRSLVLRGATLILNSTDWITDDWQSKRGWSGDVVSALAATRALENTVHVAMADRTGIEGGWKCLGHSCVAAPSGAYLARIEEGEGLAIATISLDSPEWERWRGIATYLPDRRVDLYKRLQGWPVGSRRS
ncbi:MAG: carbon-nitrogen hydrolase family protein [Armatimonadota bacterium]|nr:carbon-nitrogen hydrolase family protein [Armatimonadota bacterium]MDR7467722.1 carbon-nitrogen hydrolase family protein [Armatimonadota bacterium]MDR7499813.1 carbon-nitrogen hydrolase family protein [Armatimonadota bacterium]MDR7505241.1 carbon-nitrogen hydrolase family protein [Armatimonadota bacterium]MDR7573939.1 carbon-nitrogen hydrolase family protein [Armatimonadota bacterium]